MTHNGFFYDLNITNNGENGVSIPFWVVLQQLHLS